METESNTTTTPEVGDRTFISTPHFQQVEWDGTAWQFVCDCGQTVVQGQAWRRAIFAQTIVHVGCEDIHGAHIRSTCRTERGG